MQYSEAEVRSMVDSAMQEAREKHRPYSSWHEAYAVIKEELDEFWDGVKCDEVDVWELCQMAACCQLAIIELAHNADRLTASSAESQGQKERPPHPPGGGTGGAEGVPE